jgi:hypothetical protein
MGYSVVMQEADSPAHHSPSAVLNGSSQLFYGIAVSLCINGSLFRHKIHQKEPLAVAKTDAMTFLAEWFVLNILVAGENE